MEFVNEAKYGVLPEYILYLKQIELVSCQQGRVRGGATPAIVGSAPQQRRTTYFLLIKRLST